MYNFTMIPGDGIGPEITNSVMKVLNKLGLNINWEIVDAGMASIEKHGTPLPDEVINSIKKNKIAFKGPITTPVGGGFRSVNVALRREFDLYANVRPSKTMEGIFTRFENVNLIVVRENTEDLYCGIEHKLTEDVAESIKLITRNGSHRIAEYAFRLAEIQNRKKVTVVHKANIMKLTDGLFLEVAREVSKNYPKIQFEEMIVDAMSMKLVQKPEDYDVMVMPNLYGDILSDLCSGLVGGLGMVPSANIGKDCAIFEPVHGSAPDISGKNIANPTAALLSAVMMLRHIGEAELAIKLENAVEKVIRENISRTPDIGGNATTTSFTEAVINQLV